MKYASLIVLSYHRHDMMARSLQTLHANTDYPFELIVVDDGSFDDCWPFLFHQLQRKRVSSVIVNAGANLGVGEGIRRGFEIATGAYLAKLDADLEYQKGWLSQGVALLDARPDVGMVGFFNYRNYVASDERFNILSEIQVGDHQYGIVDDFVGSAFLIRRDTYAAFGPLDTGSAAFAEDVLYKRKLQDNGLKLAITIPDTLKNLGFGLGSSEVVVAGKDGKPTVVEIAQQPLIFGAV